ncbi:hypothetical protein BB560_005404, partial [Smittium megazygosporum]
MNCARYSKVSFNYKKIFQDPAKIDVNAKSRNVYDCKPYLAFDLYQELVGLRAEINQLRFNLNSVSKNLGNINKALSKANGDSNKTSSTSSNEKSDKKGISNEESNLEKLELEKSNFQKQAISLKNTIKDVESRIQNCETRLEEETLKFPNFTHPDSPIGDESNARVVDTCGFFLPYIDKNGSLDQNLLSSSTDQSVLKKYKDNAEICEILGLADFKSAAKISGSRFHYWTGAGVLLELALVQYTMQRAIQYGFVPFIPPELVRSTVVNG